MTFREVAELAFQSLGNPASITSVPVGIMKAVVAVTKIFSRHQGGLFAFFTTAMTSEGVALAVGTYRLADHFASLVSSDRGLPVAESRQTGITSSVAD